MANDPNAPTADVYGFNQGSLGGAAGLSAMSTPMRVPNPPHQDPNAAMTKYLQDTFMGKNNMTAEQTGAAGVARMGAQNVQRGILANASQGRFNGGLGMRQAYGQGQTSIQEAAQNAENTQRQANMQRQQAALQGALGYGNLDLQQQQIDAQKQGAFLSALGAGFGGIASLLKPGLKSDKNAKQNIKDGSHPVHEFLDSLKPKEFEYKDAPGDRRTGVIAQDVARTPAGEQMVAPTQAGLALDPTQAVGPTLAGLGNLHERLQRIERANGLDSPHATQYQPEPPQRLTGGRMNSHDYRANARKGMGWGGLHSQMAPTASSPVQAYLEHPVGAHEATVLQEAGRPLDLGHSPGAPPAFDAGRYVEEGFRRADAPPTQAPPPVGPGGVPSLDNPGAVARFARVPVSEILGPRRRRR